MQHFRLTLTLFGLTMLASVVYVAFFADTSQPDGGLEVVNIIAIGLLLTGLGFLIDMYRRAIKLKRPIVKNHQAFVRTIGAIAIIFTILAVYYELST